MNYHVGGRKSVCYADKRIDLDKVTSIEEEIISGRAKDFLKRQKELEHPQRNNTITRRKKD
jgi:hypothetical protein